jgi:hypothetical protein
LAVDKDRTASILAAGRLRVGRNDAIGDGLNRSPFCTSEEKPRTGLGGNRRVTRVWRPGEVIEEDRGAARRTAQQKKSCARQQLSAMKKHWKTGKRPYVLKLATLD